jgi:hypothetical protein
VVWLGDNARPGRRPRDLALLAFAAGLSFPDQTVREAFVEAVSNVTLSVEAKMPSGATPEDIADAAVAAGQRVTIVPARIRRIDRALEKQGVNWSHPDLAKLDPGRSDPRLTENDFVFNAVQMTLAGGRGIDTGIIGGLARMLAPAGGVAPLAGQLEYGWPLNREHEQVDVPRDEEILAALVGSGDLRDRARNLAMTTPIEELRESFRLAPGFPSGPKELAQRSNKRSL